MQLRYLIIYCLIGILTLLRIVLNQPAVDFVDGAKITARTRIITTPQPAGNNQVLRVVIGGQKISLLVSRFTKFSYGDLIEVKGVMTREIYEGRESFSMYQPRLTPITTDPWLPFHIAGWIRERVRIAFTTYLSPEDSKLLLGIVFGVNEGMGKDLTNVFQITGVMHVIAASGMNVTLLGGFLLPILTKFLKRQHALLITIICLAFYTIIAGLSASIIRATLMASIGLIGLMLGRQRTAVLSIYLTGCIMVGITPSILSDIGFQLSFAATFGMFIFKPFFSFFEKIPGLSFISEDLGSTISAQLTTMPILLYYFHSLGLLAVVVNALVLWTIPPLMVIGSISAFIGLASIQIGAILALLTLPFLRYFIFVTSFLAKVSPQLTLEQLPVSALAGYYLLLLGIVIKARSRL